MAAAAPNEETAALVSIFEEIRRSSNDPELQNAATLFIILLQSNDEDFLKEKPDNANFIKPQPEINAFLRNRGYEQTQNSNAYIQTTINYEGQPVTKNIRNARIRDKRNTRYAYRQDLVEIYTSIIPLLKELLPLYSKEMILFILTVGLQKMIDKTGEKMFFNRSAMFQNIVNLCIKYHGQFTDDELKILLKNELLRGSFEFHKDAELMIRTYTPNIVKNAKYVELIQNYQKYQNLSLIQLFKQMYELDKSRMSLDDAQKKLIQYMMWRLEGLKEKSSIELLFKQLAVDEDELASLIAIYDAKIAEQAPNKNTFVNISGFDCPRSDIVEIDCGPKGKKQVCPDTLDYPLEMVCGAFRGGRRKTRKYKKRSRRTRRIKGGK